MSGYNISYDIASFFFMLISLLCLIFMRRSRTDRYRRFLKVMLSLLFTLLFDVLGAVSIRNPAFPGPLIPTVFNSLYFFFAAFTGFAYLQYVEAFIGEYSKYKKIFAVINIALMVAYSALIVINAKTGWIFCFDHDIDYVFGPFHWICYFPSFYFVAFGIVYACIYCRKLSLRETLSFTGFAFILLGTAAQALIFPNVLLTFFFASLAVFIILLFIETPDYALLQETLLKLDAANLEVLKAQKIKSEFLSSVSREVKTPMNTVIGMSEMIRRETGDEYISGYASDISTAASSLMETINKILDYSDIESGKLGVVKAPYKVNTLIKDVYKICAPKAEEKGLKLSCDMGSLVPEMLVGDAVRIRQIMLNLISNGIKYTSAGSVTMYVGASESEEGNVMLRIRVSDTGMGIKESDIPKLFGTFERLGDVQARSGEGIGLGLAIASKLVDLMEGEIEVESTYEKGSVFTVKIPQKIAEESDLVEEPEETENYKENVKGPLFKAPEAHVLIVDDNDINRVLEAMLLKETEVKITQVAGGNDMLKELSKNNYDVVLLDHIMPDMDGIEALKRAKQVERVKNCGTAFIAITANALSGAKNEYIRQGFDDYVSKPINGKRLEEAVMNLLDESLITWKPDADA